MAAKDDQVYLDPNMAARNKVANAWIETTAGKVALTISLALCCILLIWAAVTGNLTELMIALSK